MLGYTVVYEVLFLCHHKRSSIRHSLQELICSNSYGTFLNILKRTLSLVVEYFAVSSLIVF